MRHEVSSLLVSNLGRVPSLPLLLSRGRGMSATESDVIEEPWLPCREERHPACGVLHYGGHEWDAWTAYICGCECHKLPGDVA